MSDLAQDIQQAEDKESETTKDTQTGNSEQDILGKADVAREARGVAGDEALPARRPHGAARGTQCMQPSGSFIVCPLGGDEM